jgi:hypothetical protein
MAAAPPIVGIITGISFVNGTLSARQVFLALSMHVIELLYKSGLPDRLQTT